MISRIFGGESAKFPLCIVIGPDRNAYIRDSEDRMILSCDEWDGPKGRDTLDSIVALLNAAHDAKQSGPRSDSLWVNGFWVTPALSGAIANV